MMNYQDGALSAGEMRAVEEHLLDCELCSDALEGFQLVNSMTTLTSDIKDLRKQIEIKSKQQKNNRRRFIGLAAAVTITVISSIFILRNTDTVLNEGQLATRKEKVEEKSAAAPRETEIPTTELDVVEDVDEEITNEKRLAVSEEALAEENVVDKSAGQQQIKARSAGVIQNSKLASESTKRAIKAGSIKSEEIKKTTSAVPVTESVYDEKLLLTTTEIEAESEADGFIDFEDDANFGNALLDVDEIGSEMTDSINQDIWGFEEDKLDEIVAFETISMNDSIPLQGTREAKSQAFYSISSESNAGEASQTTLKDATGVERAKKSLGKPIDKVAENIIEPRPRGGWAKYKRYISQNLIYPEAAREQGISGKVVVTFYVETDGTLTYMNIQDSLGNGCDEEAIRLIKEGPKWIPGRLDGEPTQLKTTVRVKF